ncbi:hypothetical protein DYB32_008735 [Aphanomyces invadans]|uniref:HD domain-containing protein n=1 Tax=Aphanomyces invadans TaxID=157072 RepID=A0A418AMN8_9STRA|nr:hypothetical protein DYB32_008735 [Aphanomyces invadans]
MENQHSRSGCVGMTTRGITATSAVEFLRICGQLKELWHEYEDAATDEAKLVKDIDKFEMILQADEYETAQDNLHLDQFFTSTDGKFQTPLVQSWVQELSAQRRTRRTGASTHAST